MAAPRFWSSWTQGVEIFGESWLRNVSLDYQGQHANQDDPEQPAMKSQRRVNVRQRAELTLHVSVRGTSCKRMPRKNPTGNPSTHNMIVPHIRSGNNMAAIQITAYHQLEPHSCCVAPWAVSSPRHLRHAFQRFASLKPLEAHLLPLAEIPDR